MGTSAAVNNQFNSVSNLYGELLVKSSTNFKPSLSGIQTSVPENLLIKKNYTFLGPTQTQQIRISGD